MFIIGFVYVESSEINVIHKFEISVEIEWLESGRPCRSKDAQASQPSFWPKNRGDHSRGRQVSV